MTAHRYFPGPPDHVPLELIHEFDIYQFSPGVNDPLEQWGNLLASDAPRIFYTHHNGGHWVFLDYEDVREAFRNDARFSTFQTPIPPIEPYPVMQPQGVDPPEHKKFRSLLAPLFTPAPDHTRHTLLCFEHGKHVISACPACMTLEEAAQLAEAKKRTGLRYMSAETSYYRWETITARRLFDAAGFGEMVYSEGEYYHPLIGHEKDSLSFFNGERTWRYGFPPMLSPTHSTASSGCSRASQSRI